MVSHCLDQLFKLWETAVVRAEPSGEFPYPFYWVVTKWYSDSYSSTNNLNTWYTYDQANRRSQVLSGTSMMNRVLEATYTYNADGTVKRQKLANSQGVDYVYNERAWLKQFIDYIAPGGSS